VRILVVGARGIPGVEGGAEKNAEKLFPRLVNKYSVRVLCLSQFCSYDKYEGLYIDRVPSLNLFGTDKIIYYIYSLFWVMRWKPDIIHCQGLNAAFFLWAYRWVARRVVVRYGSVDYINAKWSFVGRLGFRWCEWQLRWADAVIAVTPSLRERLVSGGVTARVLVIPNAVDDLESPPSTTRLEQLGLEPGGFILAVGRITWQKDFETLITAFEQAHRRDARLGKLVIVGGDDRSGYLGRLQAIASDNVIFTGRLPRADLGGLYTACWLYVNSSCHEGLSNAILEAISHDCPIVVSDIVENRDLPIAERHFFKVGDPSDLAEKLLAARRDARPFAVDRRAFAEWPDVAATTERLYEALLERPRPDIAMFADTGNETTAPSLHTRL